MDRPPIVAPARRTLAARLAAAAAAAALAGCASFAGLERPPRVTLIDLEPVEIRLLEQRYLATIRIQNPNTAELPIDGLEYAISINGREFATGVSNQRVTVPGFGEKTLGVGVTSSLVALYEQLRGFGESDGLVRYAIHGTLGVHGVPGGIDFDHDGEVDLSPAGRGRRERTASIGRYGAPS